MAPKAVALGFLLCAACLLGASPSFGATPSPPDLDYLFGVPGPHEEGVSVEVRLDGGPYGFTVLGLCLSRWPGVEQCGKEVVGLAVRSAAGGAPLAIERPQPNFWIVDHDPGEPLVINYRLVPTAATGAVRHLSFRSDDAISFVADTALVVPEHLATGEKRAVRYTWTGGWPEDWIAISSFGIGAAAETVDIEPAAFLHGFFYLGPAEVDEAVSPPRPPLRVVWLGSAPAEPVRRPFLGRIEAVRRVLAEELEADVGEVSMAFVTADEHPTVTAVALGPGVLFFADSPAVSGDGTEAALAAAHELIHTASRFEIEVDASPLPETFFSEALAELLARRTLLRAGNLDLAAWTRLVSDKLAALERSAASGDISLDPYVLGDLVLLHADIGIGAASDGRRGVLDWLSPAGSAASDEAGAPSWAGLMASLADLTSPAFASELEAALQGRRRFRLPPDFLAGCLELWERARWNFDPGFDARRSIRESRALAVRKGGPAWRAGLREGDVLLEWSIHWDRADLPLGLVISRDGEHRSLDFLPRGGERIGSHQALSPLADGECPALLGPG